MPFHYCVRVSGQRRREQRTPEITEGCAVLRDPDERCAIVAILQILLREQQLHGAFADGGFLCGFLARDDHGCEQLKALHLQIHPPAGAFVPVIAVAELIV